MKDIPTVGPEDIKDDENRIFCMNDLSKEKVIYLLRFINTFRLRGMVDEFMSFVINVKEIMEKYTLGESIPEFFIQKYDIYELFYTLVDYVFLEYDNAKFFVNEPELADSTIGDVSYLYKVEVDPLKVKKLMNLTKHDAIRLLRTFNTFRKRDTVDKFLTQIGDIENIYDTFSNFVNYLFEEYYNADYFKSEPELIDPLFQEKEFGKIITSEGRYD